MQDLDIADDYNLCILYKDGQAGFRNLESIKQRWF